MHIRLFTPPPHCIGQVDSRQTCMMVILWLGLELSAYIRSLLTYTYIYTSKLATENSNKIPIAGTRQERFVQTLSNTKRSSSSSLVYYLVLHQKRPCNKMQHIFSIYATGFDQLSKHAVLRIREEDLLPVLISRREHHHLPQQRHRLYYGFFFPLLPHWPSLHQAVL